MSGGTAVAEITLVGKYTTAGFHRGVDSGGHLTVTDPAVTPQNGNAAANVALFGHYIATAFVNAGNAQGGTLITDPLLQPDLQGLLAHPHG